MPGALWVAAYSAATREALWPSLVETTPNGYALGDDVTTDVEAFLRDGGTHWWRGPYLDGLDAPDEHVRDAVYAALLEATREALAAGTDTPEAVRLSRLLVKSDPYDLRFLEVHLRALQATGNRRSLGRAYDEARERLREVGERLPDSPAAFLGARTLAAVS